MPDISLYVGFASNKRHDPQIWQIISQDLLLHSFIHSLIWGVATGWAKKRRKVIPGSKIR